MTRIQFFALYFAIFVAGGPGNSVWIDGWKAALSIGLLFAAAWEFNREGQEPDSDRAESRRD